MMSVSEVREELDRLLSEVLSDDELEEVQELLDELVDASYTSGQNNMLEVMNG